MSARRFNIRVYGVCINERNELLLSHEHFRDVSFIKFPGGGLEWGEGIKDCLMREFQEEFGLEITVGELFYLTDFFQLSAFSDEDQVISVYYTLRLHQPIVAGSGKGDKQEELIWHSLADFSPDLLTFPIDKHVAMLILKSH